MKKKMCFVSLLVFALIFGFTFISRADDTVIAEGETSEETVFVPEKEDISSEEVEATVSDEVEEPVPEETVPEETVSDEAEEPQVEGDEGTDEGNSAAAASARGNCRRACGRK